MSVACASDDIGSWTVAALPKTASGKIAEVGVRQPVASASQS